MKVESNLKPENKFEIENIIDGKCDIVFFDNVQEIEAIEENEKKYSFDTYRLKANYRDELEKELNDDIEKYKEWLQLAKDTEFNELATIIREKRNKLLQESDKYMCLDRLGIEIPENITTGTIISVVKKFFEGLGESINGNYAKYRQALRDITKQEGFPYNVEFPIEPNTNDEREE
jgi:hypothetical protein|nr:MAG TPA: tail assembly chaperone protein [Caudoviricetes sp.]